MPDDKSPQGRSRPPLQFRLSSLLVLTAALASLFGTLRWLGVPPLAGLVVLVVLAVSGLAALALVVAIAYSGSGENREESRSDDRDGPAGFKGG